MFFLHLFFLAAAHGGLTPLPPAKQVNVPSNNQFERESRPQSKEIDHLRREIKWAIVSSTIFLFLAIAPLRANALSTSPHQGSRNGVTQVLPQSFVGSISVTYSIAVCFNVDSLSFWKDEDGDHDKDDRDKDGEKKDDDSVPEPGVILQLALGLLGVAGLRLILKPQESDSR
ncbi:MAG TPA: hypothetical protein VNE63_16910 [Candidatus Acidoferrales bacterium]|nr:hypothetical protein [Candidatus Acidoferrales bacterium]